MKANVAFAYNAQERNSEILALGGYVRQMTYLFLLLPRRENKKKREGRNTDRRKDGQKASPGSHSIASFLFPHPHSHHLIIIIYYY